MVSPYDIRAATGAEFEIVVQRENTLLVLGPKTYHGVVNVGVTLNLSSNLSTPNVDIVFPYRCECGIQAEVASSVEAPDSEGSDPKMRDRMSRLAQGWKDGVEDLLQPWGV